jgi:hypothetical protein
MKIKIHTAVINWPKVEPKAEVEIITATSTEALDRKVAAAIKSMIDDEMALTCVGEVMQHHIEYDEEEVDVEPQAAA